MMDLGLATSPREIIDFLQIVYVKMGEKTKKLRKKMKSQKNEEKYESIS